MKTKHAFSILALFAAAFCGSFAFSHGAVTAREMKIPAVMSVRESLARLSNGMRVRVDGAQGRVQLL